MKNGWKTSEFWVMALTSLMSIANESGLVHIQVSAETLGSIVAMAMTYIGSRSFIKAVGAYLNFKQPKVND